MQPIKNRNKLKILHIGNIANNAYLNAKILNKFDTINHVLCNDYYHIMGCPEWEDADFIYNQKDDFNPRWEQMNLNNFKRPKWFFQGSMQECIDNILDYNGMSFLYKIKRKINSNRYLYRKLFRPTTLEFTKRVEYLEKKFISQSINKGKTIESDLASFAPYFEILKHLFSGYDIVVGYSTSGIYPLLAGVIPYFAYEHGTLRKIPFENNIQGRLCSLTYQQALGTFITNCDNNIAAKKLAIKNYCFIPHPINEDYKDECVEEFRRHLLQEYDTNFLLFHPARQHWSEDRDPSLEKGNDYFIKGFAKFVKEINNKAVAIFVDWGNTVLESKKLIEELKITSNVKWIRPQSNRSMVRYIKACDCLADQFYLGAFGSTMPKALMLGTPSLIYLKEEMHQWCLNEMPPVFNVQKTDEIFDALKSVYDQDEKCKTMVKQGLAWYKKYHSNDRIAEIFLKQFTKKNNFFNIRKL